MPKTQNRNPGCSLKKTKKTLFFDNVQGYDFVFFGAVPTVKRTKQNRNPGNSLRSARFQGLLVCSDSTQNVASLVRVAAFRYSCLPEPSRVPGTVDP